MVTETVHDFPLFWGETSYEVKVLERRVFHVDKIVGDSSYWEHEVTAEQAESVGLEVSCEDEADEPKSKKGDSDGFGFGGVLEFWDWVFLKELFLDSLVEAMGLESVPIL